MVDPRLIGTHHHLFDNISDVQPHDYAAPGDVLTLDDDLKPEWLPPGSVSPASTQDDPFIVAMAVAL